MKRFLLSLMFFMSTIYSMEIEKIPSDSEEEDNITAIYSEKEADKKNITDEELLRKYQRLSNKIDELKTSHYINFFNIITGQMERVIISEKHLKLFSALTKLLSNNQTSISYHPHDPKYPCDGSTLKINFQQMSSIITILYLIEKNLTLMKLWILCQML